MPKYSLSQTTKNPQAAGLSVMASVVSRPGFHSVSVGRATGPYGFEPLDFEVIQALLELVMS
ncbi:MAG: hypothetical protein ACREXV_17720 [Polaromonas sp.]